jgi:hypothetical protein
MAKCPVCNTRKGKRKCTLVNDAFVCSLCCANTREEESCLACVFYTPPHYDYEKVPAFSIAVLENNHALKGYQKIIESALNSNTPHDVLAVLELLIIKRHFKETELKFKQPEWQISLNAVETVIQTQLTALDEETVINLLGAMRQATLNTLALESPTE